MPAGDCPSAPIDVVVTVNQWGNIVEQLAGDCAAVKTIISGTTADPHDYEPAPADIAAFADALLVVENGLAYDSWADKAIDALSTKPAVVNGGDVVGKVDGDNPHIWYAPDDVFAIADAVTAELRTLLPDATEYLDAQKAAWLASMKSYRDEIASIRSSAGGTTYAATESVFDYMAQALGLVDVTPEGYRNAAANESEPAPGDVNAFDEALTGGGIGLLVYNVQTEGSIPEQIRSTAEDVPIPVVEVTENLPEGSGFAEWQTDQLRCLSEALAP